MKDSARKAMFAKGGSKMYRDYLEKYPITFIIQEFLTHKYECGIFYYRHPNEKKGTITYITLKEFLSVRGDGISTLKELVHLNNRASL